MKRTKQPVTGESSFWKAGRNDALLRRYLGADMLQHLANGKKPAAPKSNMQLAKEYYLAQQKQGAK